MLSVTLLLLKLKFSVAFITVQEAVQLVLLLVKRAVISLIATADITVHHIIMAAAAHPTIMVAEAVKNTKENKH